MRFEDQSPSGDQPGPGAAPPPPPPPVPAEPGIRPRRRSPRSWSSPGGAPGPRTERPGAERDWNLQGRRSFAQPPEEGSDRPVRPRAPVDAPPPGAAPTELAQVLDQLRQLRADLDAVRSELAAGATERGTTLVTGAELATTIEALGTTLGNGMATLLTEHRNLLARDVDAAADRILEEVAHRLRSSGTQTADAVEERLRLVTGKALGDLGEQLDLRLDQLQTDVAGLRAVMLELPDQTAVAARLDQVLESVGSTRGLTSEIAALRRRISLRGDKADAPALSDDQLDDLADRVAARLGSTGSVPVPAIAAPDAVAREGAQAEEEADDERPRRAPGRRAGRRRA